MKLNSQQKWIGIAIFGCLLSLGLYVNSNNVSSSSSYVSGNSSNRSGACLEMLKTLTEGEEAYSRNPNTELNLAMRNLRSTYIDICN